MDATLKLFIPITKVDQAKRLVFGTLVAEEVDRVGEIFDYEGSKPLFEKWSAAFAKATNGESVGNLRAMHQPIAAGKFVEMNFLDAEKRIDVAAKVVDDAEWAKVQEGVYTGFSIGGKYVKRWADGDHMRYVADPMEGSLVDLPCVPAAMFSMVKADGTEERRAFKTAETGAADPDNAAVAKRAAELANAAGKPEAWPDFIDAARAALKAAKDEPAQKDADQAVPTNVDPRGEVHQVWRARDGQTFAKKADAIAHNAALKAAELARPINDAIGQLAGAVAKAEGQAGDQPAPETEKKAEPGPAQKAMWSLSRLSELLATLAFITEDSHIEALVEGDDSPVPEKLRAGLRMIAEALVEMTQEEVTELLAAVDQKLNGSTDKAMKAGTNWQKMHDKCVKMGAKCASDKAAAMVGDDDQAAKLADAEARVAALNKAIGDAIPIITDLAKRVEALERQPMPPKGPTKLVVVDKTDDTNAISGAIEKMRAENPEGLADLLIRAAQQNPKTIFPRPTPQG